MKRNDPEGIDERAYRFYCDVVAFVETVPIGPTTSRIIGQLWMAGGFHMIAGPPSPGVRRR